MKQDETRVCSEFPLTRLPDDPHGHPGSFFTWAVLLFSFNWPSKTRLSVQEYPLNLNGVHL